MRFSMTRVTPLLLVTIAVTMTMSAALLADPVRLKSQDDCGGKKAKELKPGNPGLHLGWAHQDWRTGCKDAGPGSGPGQDKTDRGGGEEGAGDTSDVIHVEPLKVTPEPGTLTLLATGIAGAALARHRRRRNQS